MHAVAHRPIGALAAPNSTRCSVPRRPLAKLIHPPARLSSRPSYRSIALPSKALSATRQSRMIAFLYVTGLASSLSRLLASLLHNSLLTRPFTLLTHPQSFDLISKTLIAGLFAALLSFAQPSCSSGIRKAASIKRELQSAEPTGLLRAATPYSQTPFLHQRGRCLCSPASLHILSRGVLTPAWSLCLAAASLKSASPPSSVPGLPCLIYGWDVSKCSFASILEARPSIEARDCDRLCELFETPFPPHLERFTSPRLRLRSKAFSWGN
ncbi:hypothetical protein HDV63DRAFT_405042 [Trichoderma sp. SZMC 28014]